MRDQDREIKALQAQLLQMNNKIKYLLTQNSGSSVSRFAIVAIYGDYLACNPISIVTGIDGYGNPTYTDTIDTSSTTSVAKPWLLRRSALDNPSTIIGASSVNTGYVRNDVVCNYVSDTERTAYQVSTLPATISTNTPAVSEDQILNPIYKAGDIVYAITCQNVGIINDDSGNNLTLTYLDINVDARAWSVNPGAQGNGGIQP